MCQMLHTRPCGEFPDCMRHAVTEVRSMFLKQRLLWPDQSSCMVCHIPKHLQWLLACLLTLLGVQVADDAQEVLTCSYMG